MLQLLHLLSLFHAYILGEWEMQKNSCNKRMARLPVSPADTGSLAIADMETICLK
ncbi:hypothetical protein [Enterocloster bolteae]|uniref:hypothetical protein n=1 Tax=Enterocloster bolteae TaxID=208479 RepID=UPI0026773788|nr:hypothetical protein [Enterocloster bolteae]